MTELLKKYYIANRMLSELFLDMRVYRASDIGSEYFLTLAKLRFPPKKDLPTNIAHKEIYFIIKLDYPMTKVYDGYSNKEFNRNYKTFKEAAILF